MTPLIISQQKPFKAGDSTTIHSLAVHVVCVLPEDAASASVRLVAALRFAGVASTPAALVVVPTCHQGRPGQGQTDGVRQRRAPRAIE